VLDRAVVGMIHSGGSKRPVAQNVVQVRSLMAMVNKGCVVYVLKKRDRPSDGSHSSREVAGLLFVVSGRRFRARFVFFRANIGINADVVICELAHLSVVDTDDLGLL
jgi:hypothetical protein